MSAIDPTNLGYKVSSREVNWLQMVQRAWGADFTAPDPGMYEFSNGRLYESTDRGRSGLYGVDVTAPFEFDYAGRPTHFDVDTTLMVSDPGSQELVYTDNPPP